MRMNAMSMMSRLLTAGLVMGIASATLAQESIDTAQPIVQVPDGPFPPPVVTAGGSCTTVFDCNDNDVCTLDACNSGTCSHTAAPGCNVTFTGSGGQVNISGATLFVDYFLLPAQTNDWINADGDFDCYSAANPFSGSADCGIAGDVPDAGPGPNCAYRGFVDDRSSECDPSAVPGIGMIDSDQLAPSYSGALNTYILHHYRSVGSIEGYQEFIDWQICGVIPTVIPSERGIVNRNQYAQNGGILSNGFSDCLSSGSPICPDSVDLGLTDVNGPWVVRGNDVSQADWDAKPASAGYGLYPYEPAFAPGYLPQLARLFLDCNGDTVISPSEQLNINVDSPDASTVFDFAIAWGPISYIANRGVGVSDKDSLPANVSPGNMGCVNTAGNLVDCTSASRGGDIDLTDVRHLMVLGRLKNGENLVGATRDVGSGTRNGICNTTGIDPSWCNGDNRGPRIPNATPANLGTGHQATNCGSSGIIETAVENRRLAIGFTGLSGPSRAAADARQGRYEILNIKFDDVRGGTAFVRPTIDAVLSNSDPNTGWTLGGEVSFSSKGNPHHNNVIRDSNAVPGGSFPMANQVAAEYFINTLQSVVDFSISPSDPDNFGMPADGLIRRFFLIDGIDATPALFDPLDYSGAHTVLPDVKTYARCNNELSEPVSRLPGFCPGGSAGGLDLPAYGVANVAGRVPTRNNAIYLDTNGVAGTAYRYSNGAGVSTTIAAGQSLGARNEVQGDWNNNQERDINDFPGMMAYINALEDAIAANPGDPTAAWQAFLDFDTTVYPGNAGTQTANRIIPQVIGDHNGDGNFTSEDVRYAADGLALVVPAPAGSVGKVLDRKIGFTEVDQEWEVLNVGDNNYFNTTLANPSATYDAGDSRADIAGNVTAPGAEPVGHDGVVNNKDIDYIYRQFKGFTGDAVVWNNETNLVSSAINPTTKRIADLSADINGDLVISFDDVCELVLVILETQFGDADLDGDVDAADQAILTANLGMAGGWADGDFNGDSLVNALDQAILTANLTGVGCCGDSDCGALEVCDAATHVCVSSGFACVTLLDCKLDPDDNGCNHSTCPGGVCVYNCVRYGDVQPPGGNGIVNLDDILCILSGFSNPASCPNADINPCGGNVIINLDDILAVLGAFAGANPCTCTENSGPGSGVEPLCGSSAP